MRTSNLDETIDNTLTLCRDSPGVGALVEQVVALVGHDGTGDIRTIVDQAIRDGITDAEEIAEIVSEARRDAAEEM